ncbi:MAG TPA: SLC13 family permease [Burkholderiales bacterium]|nr:SLC13 family permease [Burkholderiales bacterium]
MQVDDIRAQELKLAAEALAAVPLFAGLSPVDRAKLAGVLEERWLDPGGVVFEAGTRADALYILREGTAERRVAGSPIDIVRPPAIFGELALITNAPRSATVVAVTPIHLWVLPRSRFVPLLRAEPELMLHLSGAVGMDLARTRQILGELQSELDAWLDERLEELTDDERDLVEAGALFERPPLRVLQRLAAMEPALASLQQLAEGTPSSGSTTPRIVHRIGGATSASGLWRRDELGVYVPPSVRKALRRRLRADHRELALQTRVHAVARQLESEGYLEDAALAYAAAGAEADVRRLGGAPAPTQEQPVTAAPAPQRKRDGRRMVPWLWSAASVLPLLFWGVDPPAGLSEAGWRMLLTVISAAVLFAAELLPEAVVALALLAVWTVTGIAAPRVALDGFATQAWVLVLAVLAVGVAVGNSGLLYRVALIALGRKPASFTSRCVTLALVGTAVTPTLPNATSRMALAAPLVREVAAALGYAAGSRAAAGLALAALVGFGQMSGLFLTGSSVGLLVHGLLPDAARAQVGFTYWFVAALPLHLVLFATSMIAVVTLYRPVETLADATHRLALQHEVLGPMRRDEIWCLGVLVALIAGFLSEPLHGIHGAWIGVAALLVLAAVRRLDANMLRTGVNWNFLVFFGVITSLATLFTQLKIGDWLGTALAEPVAMLKGNALLFCIALTLLGYLLALVVRWQAAAPLLTLVAMPVAAAIGIHPFVVALISLVATQVWFLPTQSTVYLALYHGSGELYTFASVRRLAWAWGAFVLVSVAAAVPVWRWMGLIR